ncbi:MAG: AAA family ATPase [Clostridiales bacterium]|nr:AAA family ATPase [Clostridiales bacterium]
MISFSDIRGRQLLKKKLINAINNDIFPHACILVGEKGTGKKIFAKAVANALLCENPIDAKPCQNCTHCLSASVNGITEFYQLKANGKSIKVDEIREIIKSMSLKPTISQRKIYAIYDGEKMTPQAQNSLLKIFEEPPPYGYIIITVNNLEGIIPTVLSRATTYQIGNNSQSEILKFLQMQSLDKELLTLASHYSEGSIGKALKILSSEEFIKTRELGVSYVEAIINRKESDSFDKVKLVNKDNIDDFMQVVIKLFKDMVVFLETQDELFLINKDKKYIINNGINKYNSSILLKAIFVLQDTVSQLKQNASRKMTLDGMTIRILEELIND